MDVGLEGIRTIQDLIDAIKASVMVDAAGAPLRVAVEGPNAGKLLAASDTSTRWDYLYALDASLNAQGQLEIRYSQDALNAGLSGAYTLLPGMQAQLNPDGTTSSSTVVVSQAAWQLGLIAQGALQRGSDANGVLRGDALAVGHRTEFTLAGGNALVRSGGGDNTYIVNYGMGASDTGEGNRIQTQAGTGTHHLVVNTKQSVVLASGAGATDSVYYLSGATQLGKVLFTAGAMNDAALYARNEAGSVTLDATAWNAPVTLASHGGFNILKGNTSNVSFVVQQPAVTGGAQVVLSLAQAGGSNNTVQIFKYAAEATGSAPAVSTSLSELLQANGALVGVKMDTNTDNVGYVLDLGDKGVVDIDPGKAAAGRNVTVKGGTYTVEHDITVDNQHTLRLEGQQITIGKDTGANILLTAGAIQVVAQSYRPWRSTVAQIYTVEAAITVKNATLWATNANGGGISLDAKLDSALYKQPDNGPASSGIWGKITGGASKALEAVKAFTDTAGAMAAWAGIKYSTSINVGSNARLVSNSDISVKASNTVKVELSPLVAKIAGIAVGVLESYSRVTIDGRLVAAKSITVRADSDQSLTISLTPGQIGAVPAVIGVGVSVVLSDASVHIGSGARLETGLRATVDPYTYVASGVGGDVTVAAQTKHKVGISISVSGSMAESDDTKVVPPASGSTSTGPAQESGKYDAKYAKVGAAVGFAYSQVNTEVFMDGVIVARDAGKVLVQALTLDGGSAISVKTILGGRAATGGDYASKVQYEAKSAVIGKVATPISGAVTKGLGTGTQYVKSFFGALVEDSNSRTFKEKLRDVKAKKDAQKIIDYDKDIQKEIDKPSTEFQVGAALGMAINNFSTTVRIGDGQNAAQITTAGGAVQVEARSNYNTKFTVMSGVDDKVVADKQSFLKRRTTSPPTRSSAMSDRTVPTWARRRRWWSASTTSRRRRAWPPTPAFPPRAAPSPCRRRA